MSDWSSDVCSSDLGVCRVMRLVDVLEDLDDVQNVYTSVDISAEVAAGLETDED